MLAKVPARRNDGKSSFRSLKEYMTRDEPDPLTGEIKAREVSMETNCLSVKTASAEMKAAAAMNPLVKDPVYHMVISWRQGEKPTDAQMFEAARNAISAVGMEGHQYLSAIHRDTKNAHIHVMVNRVHPDTEKAVYPDRDFYKLDRCMRETELAQGWAHDNGPYVVLNGEIQRRKSHNQMAEKASTKAKDMEVHGAAESLFTYAQGAKKDVLAALKSEGANWSAVHRALAKHGLEIRVKGMGLAIYSKADLQQTPIKASDLAQELGKGKAEKKLGPYQPPNATEHAAEPEKIYSKYRSTRSEANRRERDERREARAMARADLKARYNAYKVDSKAVASRAFTEQSLRAKALLRGVSETERQKRKEIANSGLDKQEKKALRSVAAFEAARERERIRADLTAERKRHKPQTYREWTEGLAMAGDAAAISQVHGWAYNDTRKKSALAKEAAAAAANGAISADGPAGREPIPPGVLEGLTWTLDKRRGEVSYSKHGHEVFRDRGEQIGISKAAETDREIIAAALLIAKQKFNGQLTITGDAAFKARVIEIVVAERMAVTFVDKDMEAARQNAVLMRDNINKQAITTAKERRNDLNAPGNHRKQAGQVPPAHLRNRLHYLSDGHLVLDTSRDVSALRENVSDRLDQREAGIDHRMQRTAERTSGNGTGGTVNRESSHTVLAEQYPNSRPPLSGERCIGKVVAVTGNEVAQDVGRGNIVIHARQDFPPEFAKVGVMADVRYQSSQQEAARERLSKAKAVKVDPNEKSKDADYGIGD